jgi:hypothetical protein
MKTELNVIPHTTTAGLKIDVSEYHIRNFRLHQVVENLSRLMLFLLEMDSNNMSSSVIPQDVRRIWAQFNNIKLELDFAMQHNDYPRGAQEFAFIINFLDQKEIQRIMNVKVKRVASELFVTFQAIVWRDSASAQGFITQEDHDEIIQSLSIASDAMNLWIGEGKDTSDLGSYVPHFRELGVVIPAVDNDFAEVLEPSKDAPKMPVPDVADLDARA